MSFGDALVEQIPSLHRYARVLTRNRTRADDLVQDCLATALRKYDLFEAGTNFRRWLFAIMHNEYVDGVRKSDRNDRNKNFAQGYLTPAPCDSGARVVVGELASALSKLSPERRRPMVMAALYGLSYDEIAIAEGIPISTVRTRIFRGRADLARRLDYHPA